MWPIVVAVGYHRPYISSPRGYSLLTAFIIIAAPPVVDMVLS